MKGPEGLSWRAWARRLGKKQTHTKVRKDFERGFCFWPPQVKDGRKSCPEYASWHAMRERCGRPSHKFYKYYGGRGIKVCAQWKDNFSQFLADMGPRPDGGSIDRVDPNGDYTPENCRWASSRMQAINSRGYKRGVIWTEGAGYYARLGTCYLGTFKTWEAARAAIDALEIETMPVW